MSPIYLDFNATTPVDEAVLQAMLPFFDRHFGNAASEHAYGWAADEAVDQARERVADLISASPREIVFTSGATESVNLALRGLAETYSGKRNGIVTVATEHKAVLETCTALEEEGYQVRVLPTDDQGQINLDQLADAVDETTLAVAAMWANNETGVLHPVADIARIAHEKGALFVCDATQAVGKIPVDVQATNVDLLALSSHKMYGPKGVGALFVRKRPRNIAIPPQITGGGQQTERSGTLNVPGIVGLGAAAKLASEANPEDSPRIATLCDRFETALLERLPDCIIHGTGVERLPNTTSARFPGVRTARLLPKMRGVAASTGAACQVKTAKPSHVLLAMGLSDDESFSTVRFSLGRPTREEDVDTAVERIAEAVENVRAPVQSA